MALTAERSGEDTPAMQGWLAMRGTVDPGRWERHWFVLRRGRLDYYDLQDKTVELQPTSMATGFGVAAAECADGRGAPGDAAELANSRPWGFVLDIGAPGTPGGGNVRRLVYLDPGSAEALEAWVGAVGREAGRLCGAGAWAEIEACKAAILARAQAESFVRSGGVLSPSPRRGRDAASRDQSPNKVPLRFPSRVNGGSDLAMATTNGAAAIRQGPSPKLMSNGTFATETWPSPQRTAPEVDVLPLPNGGFATGVDVANTSPIPGVVPTLSPRSPSMEALSASPSKPRLRSYSPRTHCSMQDSTAVAELQAANEALQAELSELRAVSRAAELAQRQVAEAAMAEMVAQCREAGGVAAEQRRLRDELDRSRAAHVEAQSKLSEAGQKLAAKAINMDSERERALQEEYEQEARTRRQLISEFETEKSQKHAMERRLSDIEQQLKDALEALAQQQGPHRRQEQSHEVPSRVATAFPALDPSLNAAASQDAAAAAARISQEEEAAAIKIQSDWRGQKDRKEAMAVKERALVSAPPPEPPAAKPPATTSAAPESAKPPATEPAAPKSVSAAPRSATPEPPAPKPARSELASKPPEPEPALKSAALETPVPQPTTVENSTAKRVAPPPQAVAAASPRTTETEKPVGNVVPTKSEQFKSQQSIIVQDAHREDAPVKAYPIGKDVTVIHPTILRLEEKMDSDKVAELQQGALCTVMAHGSISGRRLQVQVHDKGLVGWISCATGQGETLVRLAGAEAAAATAPPTTTPPKSPRKSLLSFGSKKKDETPSPRESEGTPPPSASKTQRRSLFGFGGKKGDTSPSPATTPTTTPATTPRQDDHPPKEEKKQRKSLFGFGGGSGKSGPPPSPRGAPLNDAFKVGQEVELLQNGIMRTGEDMQSPQVTELPGGSRAVVIERGTGSTGRRLKVGVLPNRTPEGWLSCATSAGESLVKTVEGYTLTATEEKSGWLNKGHPAIGVVAQKGGAEKKVVAFQPDYPLSFKVHELGTMNVEVITQDQLDEILGRHIELPVGPSASQKAAEKAPVLTSKRPSIINFKLQEEEVAEGWKITGSPLIGKRVRRFFQGEGHDGTIVAWHPEDPLYKVIHDDGDDEDLEQAEIEEASRAFEEAYATYAKTNKAETARTPSASPRRSLFGFGGKKSDKKDAGQVSPSPQPSPRGPTPQPSPRGPAPKGQLMEENRADAERTPSSSPSPPKQRKSLFGFGGAKKDNKAQEEGAQSGSDVENKPVASPRRSLFGGSTKKATTPTPSAASSPSTSPTPDKKKSRFKSIFGGSSKEPTAQAGTPPTPKATQDAKPPPDDGKWRLSEDEVDVGWRDTGHQFIGKKGILIASARGKPEVRVQVVAAHLDTPPVFKVLPEGGRKDAVVQLNDDETALAIQRVEFPNRATSAWRPSAEDLREDWHTRGVPSKGGAMIGKRIRRFFENGHVDGTIVAFTTDADARVVHDDGDEEDLSPVEVAAALLAFSTKATSPPTQPQQVKMPSGTGPLSPSNLPQPQSKRLQELAAKVLTLEDRADGWKTTGHDLLGNRVRRVFGTGPTDATVVAWHPDGDPHDVLFRVHHDDDDLEDLTLEETRSAKKLFMEAQNHKAMKPPSPTPSVVDAEPASSADCLEDETFEHMLPASGSSGSSSHGTAAKERRHRLHFLESVSLMRKLTSQERLQIADMLAPRTYSRGDLIIRKGDDGNEIFFVEEGRAYVSMGGQRVKEYGAAQYFGELALLKRQPRAVDVYADVTPTKVLSLDGDSFRRLLGSLAEVQLRAEEYTKERRKR